MTATRAEPAPYPHARACCPRRALAELAPDELAALDRWCARALDDPDAEPRAGDEAAVVARYEALLVAGRRALGCRSEATR